MLKRAAEHQKVLTQFKCDFVPKPGEIVISDENNILSRKLKKDFITSGGLPPRLMDESFINYPFFLLPNRVKFLNEAIEDLKINDYVLINGNSCVGKSHLSLILYLHYLYQKDNFRIIYIPFFDREEYLVDLFSRSFFTFFDEITKSNELQILLNLISDTKLDHNTLKMLYDLLINETRASNKLILGLHDQINSLAYLKNLSFRFLKEIYPDKHILISTSTDPNFTQLVREDINSGIRILLTLPEMEDLDETTQKDILKHYFSLDDDIKIDLLREKTSSNFNILSEFRK